MVESDWEIRLRLTAVSNHAEAHEGPDSEPTDPRKFVATTACSAKGRDYRKARGLRVFVAGLSLSLPDRLFVSLVQVRFVLVVGARIFLIDACQFFLSF